MSDTQQTLALIALGQELRGSIVSQINRMSAALRVLPIVEGAGQNCAWAVESAAATGAAFAEGADLADYASDSQAQAVLGWARIGSGFVVTGSAARAAKSAKAGPEGARSLLGRNLKNAAAVVASTVNGQLFDGAGTTNNLAGFDVAIGDDSNTYATIVRGSSAYWRPTVVGSGSPTALSFAQMRSDRTAIFLASGEMPDLAFVHPNTFDVIGGLYDSTRRYVKEVTTARGRVVLDAGFEGLELDGMTFLKDKDAGAGKIYYVNSNHVEIQYQGLDPDVLEAMGGMGMTMPADDGYGSIPLGIRCEKQAKVGDATKFMSFTECQLVVRRPNACGVRSDVLIPS
jgi:hypothetical protein